MSKRDLDAELDIGKLPPIRRRERSFEYALRDELASHEVMFIKMKPTIKGFPDRLAMSWRGRMRLVECKRSIDEALDHAQEVVHGDLRDLGIDVVVVHGPDVKAAARIIMNALSARQ